MAWSVALSGQMQMRVNQTRNNCSSSEVNYPSALAFSHRLYGEYAIAANSYRCSEAAVRIHCEDLAIAENEIIEPKTIG